MLEVIVITLNYTATDIQIFIVVAAMNCKDDESISRYFADYIVLV